ncbi:hypothetical protein [Novilysobacter avium]|uniref:Uncharacterized protein n=1 Tax=Novilysobacter avium TaxID=2781023 RepID=A0A7S6ZUE2_9GAMM|nr:hypothetical protein [Lysobacter avium]QOW22023.1 hypothetical protein INQ42_12615 [Lysobacter avium]
MGKLFSLRVAWLVLLSAAISWAGATVRDALITNFPSEELWVSRIGNVLIATSVGYFVVMPILAHFGIRDRKTDRLTSEDGDA